MPMAKFGDKCIFFAHVPKTGGTSVEQYLQDRFADVVLFDRRKSKGVKRTGLITPSTHLSSGDLEEFVFRDISLAFAVVRDPVSRLASEYRYQYGISRTTRYSFQTWLRIMAACVAIDCRAYDNHIRPQSDLIPERCEIFRLEDGLHRVTDRVDEVAGCRWTGGSIPNRNARPARSIVLSSQDCALIADMHAADYALSGYTPPDPLTRPSDRLALAQFGVGDLPILQQRDGRLARSMRAGDIASIWLSPHQTTGTSLA